MKMTGAAYMLMIFMALMVALVAYSLGMAHYKSKLLPVVLGSAVFLMSGLELWRTMTRRKPARSAEEAEESEKKSSWSGYLSNGAWLTGFILVTYLLGFLVAMPLFLISYTRWLGTRWLTAIVIAAATSGVMYGVFEAAMQIELYRGVLFD